MTHCSCLLVTVRASACEKSRTNLQQGCFRRHSTRDRNRTKPEPNSANSHPIFLNRTNPTWSADWTEPNCQDIRTELCGKGLIPMAVKNSQIWIMTHSFIKLVMFCQCVFYLSILIVKDHQTVEPNAKYTCTAKRFYVTDVLKPNRTRTTVSIESNWTETELFSGFDTHH